MLKEVFDGSRSKRWENYGYFGERAAVYYVWTDLTPEAERVLRARVAKTYKVEPAAIKIIAVREFEAYFTDDQAFGEVELLYRPYCKAIWSICGNEDRTNVHFVPWAD
jgi:hypothetical protein